MLAAPVTIVALLASLNPLVAVPLVDPPTGPIPIKIMNASGAGCPAGSVTVETSQDNSDLKVTYGDFVATVGAGAAKPTDSRKNCQLSIEIALPAGYTYALESVDFRGTAHIEPGASARVVGDFYFAGMPPSIPVSRVINGPYDGVWVHSEGFVEATWQPCGGDRIANIPAELRVLRGTSSAATTSQISFLPPAGEASITYHLEWSHCP